MGCARWHYRSQLRFPDSFGFLTRRRRAAWSVPWASTVDELAAGDASGVVLEGGEALVVVSETSRPYDHCTTDRAADVDFTAKSTG